MAVRLRGSLRNLKFRVNVPPPPPQTGSTMFVSSGGSPSIHQYTLSTPWNSSTASFVDSFSTIIFDISGLYIRPDGLRMFTIATGSGNRRVDRYDLSTEWDITSASFVNSFSHNPVFFSNGLFFNPDGTRMILNGSNGFVFGYDLSVAWDITTAVFDDFISSVPEQSAVYFRSDGLRGFVSDTNTIYRYDLTMPWDLSTASLVNTFDTSTQDTQVSGLHFRPDGLKMAIMGRENTRVFVYDLSVAWDITTATISDSFNVSTQASSPTGIFFDIR